MNPNAFLKRMQISLFFLLSSFLPPLCQYLGCRKIKIRVGSCSRLHVHELDSWFGVQSGSSEPSCITHGGWTPCRGCSQTLAWLQSEFRSWAAVAALFNESVSQSCSRTEEAGRGATSPLRSNKSSRGDHMWHVVLHQIHIWPHNDHSTCVMKQQEEQLVLAFSWRRKYAAERVTNKLCDGKVRCSWLNVCGIKTTTLQIF